MLSAPSLKTSASSSTALSDDREVDRIATSAEMTGFDRHLLSLLKSSERRTGDLVIPSMANSGSIASRVPTHHVVDTTDEDEDEDESRKVSYALDEIDYEMGVFPFYPGRGKSSGQAEIEVATVDVLNQLWIKEKENARLRAELKAAQAVIQSSTGGLQAPSNGTGMMTAFAANSLLTPDETPPLPEGVKNVERGLSGDANVANKQHGETPADVRKCQGCGAINGSSPNGPVSQTLVTKSSSTTPSSDAGRDSPLSPEKELELLRAQVRDIARVCRAVAMGNLENKITVPVEGPIMSELKEVINGMVDQLKSFAGEVERVATEGESARSYWAWLRDEHG